MTKKNKEVDQVVPHTAGKRVTPRQNGKPLKAKVAKPTASSSRTQGASKPSQAVDKRPVQGAKRSVKAGAKHSGKVNAQLPNVPELDADELGSLNAAEAAAISIVKNVAPSERSSAIAWFEKVAQDRKIRESILRVLQTYVPKSPKSGKLRK